MEIKKDSIVFNNVVDVGNSGGSLSPEMKALEVTYSNACHLKQDNASGEAGEITLNAIAAQASASGARLRAIYGTK